MKKRTFTSAALSFTIIASALGGCNTIHKKQSSVVTSDSVFEKEMANESSFSFGKISDLDFYFNDVKGDGGTNMRVRENGTFYGYYMHTDSEDKGAKYPNGTYQCCKFIGKFSKPQKVNDYTYSTTVSNFIMETESNTEEIKDGIRYCYMDSALGISGASNVLFYLPDTSLKKLPKEYIDTVDFSSDLQPDLYAGLSYETAHTRKELPFCGLYNVEEKCGFSSSQHASYYGICNELEQLEEKAEKIKETLHKAFSTDIKMQQSEKLLKLWDNELKSMRELIEEFRDSELIAEIKEDQSTWEANKEAEIEKAGADSDDENLKPVRENLKAAELTKKWVEELAVYLN